MVEVRAFNERGILEFSKILVEMMATGTADVAMVERAVGSG